MAHSIQTFTWLSDDLEGGRRELTPRLQTATVEWDEDGGDPYLKLYLEGRDQAVADAWSMEDEVTVEFTLEGNGGLVEGTAEITNVKTTLESRGNYRQCTLRLDPDQSNVDSDKFPKALRQPAGKSGS